MSERDLLLEVVAGTLEDFAFLFGDPDPEAVVPTEGPDYLTASVHYTHEGKQGGIRLAAPEALSREIAANALGADPNETPDEALSDAVREWANLVAGGLTARLFGTGATFSLSAPQAARTSAREISTWGNSPETLRLWVDDRLVLAAFIRCGEDDE